MSSIAVQRKQAPKIFDTIQSSGEARTTQFVPDMRPPNCGQQSCKNPYCPRLSQPHIASCSSCRHPNSYIPNNAPRPDTKPNYPKDYPYASASSRNMCPHYQTTSQTSQQHYPNFCQCANCRI